MLESFLEDLTMFKVVPDTNVPGFRVGLTDDDNESARRPLPAVPSGVASGYDPYSNVLQAMASTIFRPAGLFYQGNSGVFPTPYQAYVPVSGGSSSQDPLRQAVDRVADPYVNNGENPIQLIRTLASNINGKTVGALGGGWLGNVLGGMTGFPGGGYLGGLVGGTLGGILGAGTDFTANAMIDAAPLGANPVAP
jgi:hypothetical protein